MLKEGWLKDREISTHKMQSFMCQESTLKIQNLSFGRGECIYILKPQADLGLRGRS